MQFDALSSQRTDVYSTRFVFELEQIARARRSSKRPAHTTTHFFGAFEAFGEHNVTYDFDRGPGPKPEEAAGLKRVAQATQALPKCRPVSITVEGREALAKLVTGGVRPSAT